MFAIWDKIKCLLYGCLFLSYSSALIAAFALFGNILSEEVCPDTKRQNHPSKAIAIGYSWAGSFENGSIGPSLYQVSTAG